MSISCEGPGPSVPRGTDVRRAPSLNPDGRPLARTPMPRERRKVASERATPSDNADPERTESAVPAASDRNEFVDVLRHLDDLEDLDLVTLLDVVVALEVHAALLTCPHFPDIVFETPK